MAGSKSFAGPVGSHVLTLSFDDGFKKSFYKAADIYERLKLKACFNIIASAHLPSFQSPNPWIMPKLLGNFDDWNALQRRGHEIGCHTWDHKHAISQPLERATADIVKCIDYFEDHLEGFDPKKAVYNFAYNEATPELEQFALARLQATRAQGDTPYNPVPASKRPIRLGCYSNGPGNCDNFVEKQINEFLALPGGWMILNVHGLDDEGWGPMSTGYLQSSLERLGKVKHLEMLPAATVFARLHS